MNRRQLLISGAGFVALGAAQMGSTSDYADATDAMRLPLAAYPDVREYIRFATLAPTATTASRGNSALPPGASPSPRTGRGAPPSSIPTTIICSTAWAAPPKT